MALGDTALRSSRDDVEKHRKEIVEAAARLFRERGVDGVSVPALMQAVGMTHGGFYKHFASKDALVAVAWQTAFDQIVARLSAAIPRDGDKAAGWAKLVNGYLSPAHRDDIGAGCAAAAFAGDAARLAPESPARATYDDGIERMLKTVSTLRPQASRAENLAALSTLIGALLLSRASDGAMCDEFLAAARAALPNPDLTKA